MKKYLCIEIKGDRYSRWVNQTISNIKNFDIALNDYYNDFEKNMNHSLTTFTQENCFKEKYYEDFGGVYMMLIGILMKLNMEKEDIRNMQARGTAYAQNNFIGSQKYD